MKTSYIKHIALFCIVAVFATFCVVQRSPITGSKRAYGYSWEKEIQIGKEADQEIQQQYGIYKDENLLNYIENVGQQVLSVSHMRRQETDQKYRETEFYFRVLNSPVVNAFALPGGYVYVTRGLLAHLENEAQLAVVLGHEIAHVAARHASQRAFEQKVGQLALIGGAVASEELLGVPGQSVLQLGGQAAQLLFLSYGRDDERESDNLGVEYAAKKNYEAAEGAGFFSALERISEQSGSGIPTWQSSHPDPSERAKTIPKLAEQWQEKGYEQNIENTSGYMNAIDGMVFGQNPREGFAENGSFYHPELQFQFNFPSDWELINQPNLVAVVSESEDAVSIMQIDGKTTSPEASVIDYVGQDGFTVESSKETQYEGLQGYEAIASAVADDGSTYRFYVYAVSYGDNIYRFISYCLAQKFVEYRPSFEKTSNSFTSLNDRKILNIQPMRLEAFKTEQTGLFSSFLPDDLPMNVKAEDIAILNQVELDATIEAGEWIKVPRQSSIPN